MTVTIQPDVILEFDISGQKLQIEVAEAWYDISEMWNDSIAEWRGDELRQERATYEKIRAYLKAKDIEASIGQVKAIEVEIQRAYEDYKKKLPALPISATSLESSPVSSPSETPLSSEASLEDFARLQSLGSATAGASLPPNVSSPSS